MKKLLFILFISTGLNLSAQTDTYNLNWFAGIGNSVDLTIETGDTVIWTWTSPNHSVENDPSGSSVETFDSGVLQENGSTFSYTFTVLGSNDYYCGVHGAASMSGTITVVAEGTLSSNGQNAPTKFSIYPNPSSDLLNISLPRLSDQSLNLEVFDVLGKRVYTQQLGAVKTKVNISKWNSGVYLVRLTSADDAITLTKRFVKL